MMTFREFKKKTPKAKAKGEQGRQTPAAQAIDQSSTSKNPATQDGSGDGEPLILGIIEGIGPPPRHA